MCLDVLRVVAKQPDALELLLDEYAEVKGQERHFDRHWRQLQQRLRRLSEAQGREITSQLYLFGVGGADAALCVPTGVSGMVSDDA
ncbi:Putative acyl-CoA dehydrogenase AidB [Kluyvera cryocrescens]|uniref:Acyl-CoA dehydrogenase AidB n=1 Tax=Kluyvera cryocrescens TaxID=580 RepID=A0A485BAP6_KLUCR|nr:Putative acyl-CoA dehydrogenase AidB [Kluyvera cryocrescens]